MNSDNKRNLIVADICNTLFDSNTTYDFIAYCVSRGRLPGKAKLFHSLLLSKISPLFWMTAVAEKLTKKDISKKLVVRFLKGCSVANVRNWAGSFYQEYLKGRNIESTLLLLDTFKREDIILVSSTLEPIAAVIAENLSIASFIATELEVDNEYYTGKIVNELSGKKLSAIRRLYSDEARIEAVITDNFTDKELMYSSVKKFAVCYSQHQEKFWSVIPGIQIIKIRTI